MFRLSASCQRAHARAERRLGECYRLCFVQLTVVTSPGRRHAGHWLTILKWNSAAGGSRAACCSSPGAHCRPMGARFPGWTSTEPAFAAPRAEQPVTGHRHAAGACSGLSHSLSRDIRPEEACQVILPATTYAHRRGATTTTRNGCTASATIRLRPIPADYVPRNSRTGGLHAAHRTSRSGSRCWSGSAALCLPGDCGRVGDHVITR